MVLQQKAEVAGLHRLLEAERSSVRACVRVLAFFTVHCRVPCAPLQWRKREATLEEDVSTLRRELEERFEQVQRLAKTVSDVLTVLSVSWSVFCRTAIGEDVEKIRLQRELQSKTGRLEAVQTQCEVLERNLSAVKDQNTRLLEEVEALNQKVKEVCIGQYSVPVVSVSEMCLLEWVLLAICLLVCVC